MVDKDIEVYIDDVDPVISDAEVLYMVRCDVKEQMRRRGNDHYVIGEIENV